MRKTAFLLIFITLISKLVGFLREVTLSYHYGTSDISDAYLIALTIPTVIFTFLGTAFSTGYIPMYNKVQKEKGNEGSIKFTNNIVNILFVIFTVFTAISYIFSPQIVKVFALGFEGNTLSLAIEFTRISIFSIYFTGLVQLFSGYLQIKGNYIMPALIGFPLNLCMVITIILSGKVDVVLLPIGIVIATASQFILLIPFIKKNGYRHKFFIDLKDRHIKKILYISVPIILGAVVNDINVLVDRTLASQIAVGGISALNYANILNNLVQSIFVLSISTAIYPTICKMAANQNINGLKKSIREAINAVSFLVIPSTVGSMVLAKPVISILFGRGAFDQNAIEMTAQALFFYSIGMIGFGLRQILIRGFYSLQDTKTPVINSSLGMLINIALNFMLSKYLGISGLALATSISAIFTSILLIAGFGKKVGSLGIKNISISLSKIVLASTIMGIIVHLTFSKLQNICRQDFALLLAVGAGIAIYAVNVCLLKVDEVKVLIDAIRKKLINSSVF